MITSHSVKLTLETNSVHTTDQPTVLLIGTSNIKFIKEDKLTPFAKVIKQIGYTLDETYQFISSSELTSPDLVLFHPFTNDIKKYDPKQCVDKMNHIIKVVQHKWPQSKIIISLATPKADEFHHHTNGQILNTLLEQHVLENQSVTTLNHSNMVHDGSPDLNLLNEDGVHLNEKGVSLLASNMKRIIHNSLGLKLSTLAEQGQNLEPSLGLVGTENIAENASVPIHFLIHETYIIIISATISSILSCFIYLLRSSQLQISIVVYMQLLNR